MLSSMLRRPWWTAQLGPHPTRHDAYELVSRNIIDRFAAVVLDAGIDEQQVKLSRRQPRSQRGHLIRDKLMSTVSISSRRSECLQ